jgi:hypothetical protein
MPVPEMIQNQELDATAFGRSGNPIGRAIAWFGLFLVVLLAVLGFTGRGGIFARAEARADHASLDYPRVMRRDASEEIIVRLDAPAGKLAEIVLDPDLFAIVRLDEVVPRPVQTIMTPEGFRLVFEHERAQVDIVLPLRPAHASWFQTYSVRATGGPMTFNSLILP